MLGITIGSGKGWKENAKAAALQMQNMTGIECLVFDYEEPNIHPVWHKALIPAVYGHQQHKHFLYFDADIYCIKPWNPQELIEQYPNKFMACLDRSEDPYLLSVCHLLQLDPWKYINAGLYIFGEAQFEMFHEVWKHRFNEIELREQSVINQYIKDRWDTVHLLDKKYNRMIWLDQIPEGELYNNSSLQDDTINIHSSYEQGFENDNPLRYTTKLQKFLPRNN